MTGCPLLDSEYAARQNGKRLPCERLADENAKLRHDLEDANNQAEEVCIENAKLRELVRDMYKALFSLNLDHCQACPREDTCVFIHECAFERDMRELGVEVDE